MPREKRSLIATCWPVGQGSLGSITGLRSTPTLPRLLVQDLQIMCSFTSLFTLSGSLDTLNPLHSRRCNTLCITGVWVRTAPSRQVSPTRDHDLPAPDYFQFPSCKLVMDPSPRTANSGKASRSCNLWFTTTSSTDSRVIRAIGPCH
jgi:hypothetical protein